MDPPDNRILAVTEMETPRSKKDVQKLCGMISSLKPWFPSINFSTDALRKGCAQNLKFIWTPEMNLEFEKVKLIFTDQIRLSPFNPDREINILIDAANIVEGGVLLLSKFGRRETRGRSYNCQCK